MTGVWVVAPLLAAALVPARPLFADVFAREQRGRPAFGPG
jgi:hypothetical protein